MTEFGTTTSPEMAARNGGGSERGRHPLGPYSRGLQRAAIGQFIDGRSKEGRFLRAYEAMLLRHLGPTPSAVEKALAARCARLALYLELMDERSLANGGQMTPHDSAQYLAWSNAHTRCLARIGLKAAPKAPQGPTLAEYLNSKANGHAPSTEPPA